MLDATGTPRKPSEKSPEGKQNNNSKNSKKSKEKPGATPGQKKAKAVNFGDFL